MSSAGLRRAVRRTARPASNMPKANVPREMHVIIGTLQFADSSKQATVQQVKNSAFSRQAALKNVLFLFRFLIKC